MCTCFSRYPPKVSVSGFMGYLKGKSSLMIYERYPSLQYKSLSLNSNDFP